MMSKIFVFCVLIFFHFIYLAQCHIKPRVQNYANNLYDIDVGELGLQYDGIGAISGGGATSKLLINYQEPERSEILDFLFKPGFAASLHILKVEIGGDSQSTDGAESSHMHSEDDENYNRGYEWWLMKEAKKRNPSIKLYGLPWVFPGWLGGGQFTPYFNRSKLVTYITNWVHGAKLHHGLDIDYLGVWNERTYDIEYLYMLKQALLSSGYGHIKLVAPDAMSWGILEDYAKSQLLRKSLDIIGYHYPGSYSPPTAQELGVPLWASEDYSASNTLAGGGCWGRVLNEGYVNGRFTGYIAWNLITSYYDNLPYSRSSLMTANQPWSGHYEVNSPIWMTAHHTQFTEIGWHYLKHGVGTGNLTGNGTYITYTSPDSKHLTIVIETLDPSTSPCFYHMPHYNVSDTQTATFNINTKTLNVTELYVWHSYLDFVGDQTDLFRSEAPMKVVNGQFSLDLNKNSVYTLTTVNQGTRGSYKQPPASAPFPVPYTDDFETYTEFTEPYNLVQQAGVWEVRQTNDLDHSKVIEQVVPEPPIDTCRPNRMTRPVAVMGNFDWSDVSLSVDIYTSGPPGGSSGVYLGVRVGRGGCDIMYSNGVFLWIYPHNSSLILTGNFSQSLQYMSTAFPLKTNTWYTVGFSVKGKEVHCTINNVDALKVTLPSLTSSHGFLAVGTTEFKSALFDNLNITSASVGTGDKDSSLNKNLKFNRALYPKSRDIHSKSSASKGSLKHFGTL